MPKSYALRAALVGVAVTIGLLGAATPAAAMPGSGSATGSAEVATGSATGSAQLSTGSASGSAGGAEAATTYFGWQSSQFFQRMIQLLLMPPRV
ncbi:hypothetical protein [Nocardia rhizosphaerae]|uniref:Uncharacterized protein n=1 Tax=Nocardia rhizosphaerae TaxID=1691571 RepID=A0ABV8L4H5_9NOCA